MPQDAYTRQQWQSWHEPIVYHGDVHTYHGELHPDTEPAAIAEAQREAVRACLWLHRLALTRPMPAEEISEIVVLPVSVVRRRLAEIDGENVANVDTVGDSPPGRVAAAGANRG